MQSVDERLKQLEDDLLAHPIRISAYHDLPFAIFCYPPNMEFPFRNKIQLFKTRLENSGKIVISLSLADMLWESIEKNDSIENITQMEEKFGYARVEDTIRSYLTIEDFSPLPQKILKKIKFLNPIKDIVFINRAGAMAPGIYRMSVLLNEIHGKTMVPIILFYPGSKESETELRFMDIEGRQAISGYNYRVKIY